MKSASLFIFAMTLCIAKVGAQGRTDDVKPPPLSMTPPQDAPPVVGAKPGPYAVSIETLPTLPKHTIYRPRVLSNFNGSTSLPVVAWGEGGCLDSGLAFKEFLSTIASYGFVVIAVGAKDTPMPDYSHLPTRPVDLSKVPPPKTKDSDLTLGIDWATAEAKRKDSPFYQHLNPQKVAIMGQSCGGLQAIASSADPRVKTSMIWNSGTFPGDPPQSAALSSASKASLARIHAPVAYINGGPTDIAYPNSTDDVIRLTSVPVFYAWVSVGHGGTYDHPGGGRFAPVAVAWLQWRLNGDPLAAKQFEGKDCGLCKDPVWHVVRKD